MAPSRPHPCIVILIALMAFVVPLLSCNEDEDENVILPVHVSLSVAPVADDPALFFQSGGVSDNVVNIHVMLRNTAALEFDAVNLRVRWDPGLVQFAGMQQSPSSDGKTYTPYGLCGAAETYCPRTPFARVCNNLTSQTCGSDTDCPGGACIDRGGAPGPLCGSGGNGEALIGMDAVSIGRCDHPRGVCDKAPAQDCFKDADCPLIDVCVAHPLDGGPCDPGNPGNTCVADGGTCRACDAHSDGGTIRLMTLSFIASAVGESRIELISSGQSGDCEVLNNLAKLGIPCIDGGTACDTNQDAPGCTFIRAQR